MTKAMTSPEPSKRVQRQQAFREFFDSVEETFGALRDGSAPVQRLHNIYSFYIQPGGRMGGQDNNQVEIFFGNRPFGEHVSHDQSMRLTSRLLTEHGATLEFYQDALGRNHVLLYPAAAEGMRSAEDYIDLGIFKLQTPHVKRAAARYFGWFMAYMQCTCLEGEPTVVDRLTVAWLRFAYPRNVDGRLVEPSYLSSGKTIVQWALTVGFSGILFSIFQCFWGPHTVVDLSREPIVTLQQRAELIQVEKKNSERLTTVEKTLESIRDRLDIPFQTTASSAVKSGGAPGHIGKK